MAYTLNDLLESVRQSRRHFLKHILGLREDQWNWKPYPECKSVSETLAHLITDDRAFLETFETGQEPGYENLQVSERDPAILKSMLADSHDRLLAYLSKSFSATPLETEIDFHGMRTKLAEAIGWICAEDYYHAGQIGFIRMATDPGWDYYATIYG